MLRAILEALFPSPARLAREDQRRDTKQLADTLGRVLDEYTPTAARKEDGRDPE